TPFEAKAAEFLKDPWTARNDYVDLIADHSAETLERFLLNHALRELKSAEVVTVRKLLELQRHTLLMYTSCGWFYDDLSGMEAVEVLEYAARAIQLAQEVLGLDLEQDFLSRLEQAKSNTAERGDGRKIYEAQVRPARIDWAKIGAHYAVSSLFEEYPEVA